MVVPGYGYGIVARPMAALGYGGPQSPNVRCTVNQTPSQCDRRINMQQVRLPLWYTGVS